MRKIILTIVAVMAFTSLAFAAVSSPCGYRKPAKAPVPRVVEDTGYRRDVLDNRVPTQSVKEGDTDSQLMQATKDRETLISGKN